MNPPEINTLEADVAFYLFHLSQRVLTVNPCPALLLTVNPCPALLKELTETYGEADVSSEIERQRSATGY